jgi:hypothetical protein
MVVVEGNSDGTLLMLNETEGSNEEDGAGLNDGAHPSESIAVSSQQQKQ